jgi:phosphoribosylanthranilate isomerase
MAKVKVKICGITNWVDARRAVAEGATLLGFNFYAGSARYVKPATAKKIVSRLPKRISAVGVFVNESEQKMLEIARAVGLDTIQLHGDESPAMVARLKRSFPVIKAIRVRKSSAAGQLGKFQVATALLLDGFDTRQRGGTGKTFDWKVARRAKRYGRIFLAGGLTPENVGEAILVARPYAVDVCSGVEARPGKKDPARLRSLMRAAKDSRKPKRST